MKKVFIFSILFFLSFLETRAQQLNSDYLQAIIRIQNDSEIIERIKKSFKKEVKNEKKAISYQVSSDIIFIDIIPLLLESNYNNEEFGLDSKYLEQAHLFRNEFKFKSEKIELLGNILESTSKLYLHFSRRYGNVLAVEITNSPIVPEHKIRFGRGLVILFFFNSNGSINNLETPPLVYEFLYN